MNNPLDRRMKNDLAKLLALLALLATFAPATLGAPGDLDPGFNPNANGSIYGVAVQPDGKIVIGGSFTTVGAQTRNRVARLNADGTLDTSFNPNANNGVNGVAVQADGKILLGGQFSIVGGLTRNSLARVDANGALDTSFNPNPDKALHCIALQPDGKILIGGQFTTVSGVGRSRIARLNPDGTLDTQFDAGKTGPLNVDSIAVQADGKIVIGGSFTLAGAITRNRIARLNPDGTLDTSFDPNANDAVPCVAVAADGKIVIGGTFTMLGTGARNHIARLNLNGTVDTSFNPEANGNIDSIAIQADGKIVIGGSFTAVNGVARSRLARLNLSGTLDTAFNPGAGDLANCLAVQVDGKIFVGGAFTAVSGTTRNHAARLENDPATQSLTVPSSSTVQWLRGGSSPETLQVTFELSINNGATWTLLGSGLRIPGGWSRTGLSLPGSGQIRARARAISGNFNGSSGLIESLAPFSTCIPEMIVRGKSVTILDGDTTPTGNDNTDFFDISVCGASKTHTFTIFNFGRCPLTITNITSSNPSEFAVGAMTFPIVIPAGGAWRDFTVTFDPSGVGARTATVSIGSDDSTTSPYTFALGGNGIVTPTQLVLTCATNKIVNCGAAWTFDPPTAREPGNAANVPVTIVNTVTNGNCPQVITRTWQAVDACGNTNMCRQTVTVVDTTPPVLTCATNKTVLCGTTWSFDPPTALDACSGTNVVVRILNTETNFIAASPQTLITRTWQAVDACGVTNVCSQTVTVLEGTLPTIVCPADITVMTSGAGSVVTFADPTVTGGALASVSPASGSTFPLGTNRVTCTATNACGASTCTFSVIVIRGDTKPSFPNCLYEHTGSANPTSEGWTAQNISANTTVGPVPGLIPAWGITNSAAADTGAYSVVPTAADLSAAAQGWSLKAIIRVTTNGVSPGGSMMCLYRNGSVSYQMHFGSTATGDPMVLLSDGGSGNTGTTGQLFTGPWPGANNGNNTFELISTCGGRPDLYINGILTYTGWGGFASTQTTVTWGDGSTRDGATRNVSDAHWAQVSFCVAGPCLDVICPINKTVECGKDWKFDLPTATSCCGTNITIQSTGIVTNGICPQLITQSWLITDGFGNTNTCRQTVTVVDTTLPVLTCATNKTVPCGTTWSFDPPTALDACSGTNLTVTVRNDLTNSVSPLVITRTWQAVDACGNTNTCSQTVTVLAAAPPVITCPKDITVTTVGSNAVVSFADPTITGGAFAGSTPASDSVFTLGTTVVTCTATNACGASTCTFNVTVIRGDIKPSFPNCLYEHTGSANPTSEGWTAQNISANTTVGPVPGLIPAWGITNSAAADTGAYSVVPTAADLSAAAQGWSLKAIIRVTTNGVSPGGSMMCLYRNGSVSYQMHFGSTANGNPQVVLADGLSNNTGTTGPLLTGPWLGVNNGYNTFELISASGGHPNLYINGVLAYSAWPGFASSQIAVSWGDGSTRDGAARNVSDAHWAQVSFCVAGPCLDVICPINKTVECGKGWKFDLPTATSCCGTNITIRPTGIVTNNVACPQVITQSWLISDGCGNTNTCRQTVAVVDTTPPLIACPADPLIVPLGANCQLEIPTIRPLAVDNCTPASQLIYTQNPPAGTIWTELRVPTVTVTVSDACGNVSRCDVIVIGRDRTPPVVTRPQFVTALTDCVVPDVLAMVSATDNCTPSHRLVFKQSPAAGIPIAAGANVVSVTVTDQAGNTTTVLIPLVTAGQQSFLDVMFNTGVGNNKVLLNCASVDPHFTLGPVPAGTPTGPGGYDAPDAVVGCAFGSWNLPPFTSSRWITPNATSPFGYPNIFKNGAYTYTNQFVLPSGANPLTASISGRWAADNGAGMYLNGLASANQVSNIPTPLGHSYWTYFTVNGSVNAFLAPPAVNTLYFVVTNLHADSITGLRVEFTNAIVNCGTCTPPAVTSGIPHHFQPVNSTAVLGVNVWGTPPLTIQWYHNGVALSNGGHYSGVNTTALTVSSIGYTEAGIYRAVISNACGQATSAHSIRIVKPLGPPTAWGWWNFSHLGRPLVASFGPDLSFSGTNDLSVSSGTTFDFGLPNLGGNIANVMYVPPLPAGNFIKLPFVAAPGSNSVSNYTLLMDLYAPSNITGRATLFTVSDGWGNLKFSTVPGIAGERLSLEGKTGEKPVNLASSLILRPGVWNRTALVVESSCCWGDEAKADDLMVSIYLNGNLAGSTSLGAARGALGLSPNSIAAVFSSPEGTTGELYVGGLQFHGVALTPEMIASIGSPNNGPIHANDSSAGAPPVLSVMTSNGTVNLSWRGSAFVLEETTDLISGTWQESFLPFDQCCGDVDTNCGDECILTTAHANPTTESRAKFYRLKRP